MKVLVTEDCPTIQSLYALVMHANDINNVDYAASAEQSRDLFQNNAYDAIFLDIELQGADVCGIDLLKELRQIYGVQTPIYIVSTLSDRSTVHKCLQYGATGCIDKGRNFFRDVAAALSGSEYRLSA